MSYFSFEQFETLLLYLRDMGFSDRKFLAAAGISCDDVERMRISGRVPRLAVANLTWSIKRGLPTELHQSAWAGGFGGERFRLMALAVISASDLGEGLDLARNFYTLTLFDDRHPAMDFRVNNGLGRLIYTPPAVGHTARLLPRCPDFQYLEDMTVASALGLWFLFMSWLIGQRVQLVCAGVHAPDWPRPLTRRFTKLLGIADFRIGQQECYLEFPARYLALPIVQTAKTLKTVLSGEHVFETGSSKDEPISDRLGLLLGDDFSGGCPSFVDIARRLVLSPASLRRRLMKEGKSYHEVKDSARQQLAFRLLAETNLSLNQISERVGFSEQSSFSRSFKEWTGLSPREFRASKGGYQRGGPAQLDRIPVFSSDISAS